MLPGGLDIIGIFLVASPESIGQYQGQLRNLIYKIYKVCKKCYQLGSEAIPENTDRVERILLQISLTTRKYSYLPLIAMVLVYPVCIRYTCRVLDISDQKVCL